MNYSISIFPKNIKLTSFFVLKGVLVCIVFLSCSLQLQAQEDLLDDLESEEVSMEVSELLYHKPPTFKALRLGNMETTKLAAKNEWYFAISHRFGAISGGINELYGLDNAFTRLEFDYGITERLQVNMHRSAMGKTYGVGLKYGLFKGDKLPFEAVLYHASFYTAQNVGNLPGFERQDRMSYISQILLSKSIRNISVLFAPGYIHQNARIQPRDIQTAVAFSLGLRYKLTTRFSLLLDTGWHLSTEDIPDYTLPATLTAELETGGHIFHIMVGNSRGMNEVQYLSTGQNELFIGFNIYRVF